MPVSVRTQSALRAVEESEEAEALGQERPRARALVRHQPAPAGAGPARGDVVLRDAEAGELVLREVDAAELPVLGRRRA